MSMAGLRSCFLALALLILPTLSCAQFAPLGTVGRDAGGSASVESGALLTASVISAAPVAPASTNGSSLPFFNVTLPSCGVSGIHAAITHLKTVVFIDRTDTNNSLNFFLPNSKNFAYASEWNWATKAPTVRPLDVKSNVFCSAGQFLPNGTLLSIGGSTDASSGIGNPILNGSFSIRGFTPCTDGTCDFQLLGTMTSKRWYPTAQIVPGPDNATANEGRVIIYGGANVFGNIAINTKAYNNPSYEFWPRKAGEGRYFMDFLDRTLPFNLYPFVHLLPSGNMFLFAGQEAIIHDYVNNKELVTLPKLLDPVNGFRLYPVSGSSALLPLRPSNNYTAEILICGGGTGPLAGQAPWVPDARVEGRLPGLSTCHRITPEAKTPSWSTEDMGIRRVMPDLLHMVDGNIAIVNGAGIGFEGLKPTYANNPTFNPIIYSQDKPVGQRMYIVPNATRIARMYHSSALIMPDASILISGSNPNPYYISPKRVSIKFPTEMRVETFYPPYLHTDAQRPELLSVPTSFALNTKYVVTWKANVTNPAGVTLAKRFSAIIMDPGFSTHNQRHGMRYIQLKTTPAGLNKATGIFSCFVYGPPSKFIAPPTKYWFHILDNGLPNKEGVNVNVVVKPVKSKKSHAKA